MRYGYSYMHIRGVTNEAQGSVALFLALCFYFYPMMFHIVGRKERFDLGRRSLHQPSLERRASVACEALDELLWL
jgi:hypothetical protein